MEDKGLSAITLDFYDESRAALREILDRYCSEHDNINFLREYSSNCTRRDTYSEISFTFHFRGRE